MAETKKKNQTKAKANSGKDKMPNKKAKTTKTPPPSRSRRKKVTPGELMLHLSMAITALFSFAVAVYLNQPTSWALDSTGSLLAEFLVDSPDKAKEFADLSIQEVKSIWDEPSSNWYTMYNGTQFARNRLTVECRQVTEGFLKDSSVHLARSEGIFRGVTAKEALDFMASPEGFAILDPAGSRTDFYQTIESIPGWREGGAKTEIAQLNIPGRFVFLDRHFLVLSSMIPEEGIFVAKSVLHSSRPGASALYAGTTEENSNDNQLRSLVTYAFKVEPEVLKNGEEVINVKMISYVNLFLYEKLMSFASCKWLFPDLYRGFQAAFDAKRHMQKE